MCCQCDCLNCSTLLFPYWVLQSNSADASMVSILDSLNLSHSYKTHMHDQNPFSHLDSAWRQEEDGDRQGKKCWRLVLRLQRWWWSYHMWFPVRFSLPHFPCLTFHFSCVHLNCGFLLFDYTFFLLFCLCCSFFLFIFSTIVD